MSLVPATLPKMCEKAVKLYPKDATSLMHMGLLSIQRLDFRSALQWLLTAAKLDPENASIQSNLAIAYASNKMKPEMDAAFDRAMQGDASARTMYFRGFWTVAYNRTDEHVMSLLLQSATRWLREATYPEEFKQASKCDGWTYRIHWLEAKNVSIVNITNVATLERFGPALSPVFEGQSDVPLAFTEKQVIAVTIENAYLDGVDHAIPYTACEVYAPMGLLTKIPHNFLGHALESVVFTEDVISLWTPYLNNYYHFMSEFVCRLLYSYEHFIQNGAAPQARILLPRKSSYGHAWDVIDALNLKFPQKPIEYEPLYGRRYEFKRLHIVSWEQPDCSDIDQNDLWSMYLPPKAGLLLVRAYFHAHASRLLMDDKSEGFIVYISRASKLRSVEHEQILLGKLKRKYGSRNVKILTDNASMRAKGLNAQISLFRNAQIIIGPHGAGLTNMIFAPSNATVIEFSMDPHVNRCFGYMAMALGLDYWLVPQVLAFYYQNYVMDAKKADYVMRLVRHVVSSKGLAYAKSSNANDDHHVNKASSAKKIDL